MIDWEAPAIVLAARPFGEADALATILTRDHGATRGLTRGGQSRRQTPIWQPGNLVTTRYAARLPDQLGTLTAELVHPGAALALDDPLALAILAAACAVAEGALPEREPHPRIFDGLVHLIAHVAEPGAIPTLVRWELTLLSELGYGLDLTSCAVTGRTDTLTHVSPRTGRAVSAEAATPWLPRLLPLPAFLSTGDPATPPDCAAGLRLTAHFLARDAFGHHHRPVPPARDRLETMVTRAAPPPP